MVKRAADVAVIGGGCIGINIAVALRQALPASASVVVIEKEAACGRHASTRNSGVLHAGFYYAPGSLKARMTRDGNRLLSEFIEDRGLPIRRSGKLVVTRNKDELITLHELHRRGIANGIDVQLITEKDAMSIEPKAFTIDSALWSPNTSVADPVQVMRAQVEHAVGNGVDIQTGCQLHRSDVLDSGVVRLSTNRGTLDADHLVNAAGVHADRIAAMLGAGLGYEVIPFKGLYVQCGDDFSLSTNVYPVPNIHQPFLGTHLTVCAKGGVKVGPTALPAWSRENYEGIPFAHPLETVQIAMRLARLVATDSEGIRTLALQEATKCWRRALMADAATLIRGPAPPSGRWLPPGIRAQLMRDGKFVHDFVIESGPRSTHVLNAVSPGWTCAIPFARHVVHEFVLPALA
ncbi:L-2-hydroxyglutarate dehydrogenase, mitochondrial [Plasmodiophora brassicae]